MEKNHVGLARKILLALIAVLMCVTAVLGVTYEQRNGKMPTANEPVTAAAASPNVTTQLTALKFVNDTSVKIDAWTLSAKNTEKNIPGKPSTFTSKPAVGGEYCGSNNLFTKSFTNLYFKGNKDPKNIAGTTATLNNWYWDRQANTTNVLGPYKIETTLYALSVNGNLYLPYGIICTNSFILQAGLYPISGYGETINATKLYQKLGGLPQSGSTTSIYLPIDETGWLKWDSKGRAYFEWYFGTIYITVDGSGKVGTTDNADKAPVLKPTTQPIPEGECSDVTKYEQQDGKTPESVGSYDGKGNKCPVKDSVYYTVGEATNTTSGNDGDAGTYTAQVTPKEGYTWEDGTSEPKTVTWTVDKAQNDVTLPQTSVTFEKGETEKRIKLTVGEMADLTGATCSVQQGGQDYSGITASIDEDTQELVLTRTTKDGVSDITVTVTLPESTNFEAKTLDSVSVTLTAGEGFYVEGNPDKIYDTLQAAIEAANGSGSAIVVNGNVTIEADEALTLPENLTLKGAEGSKLTVMGDKPLFDVGSGKSLSIEGLTVETEGPLAEVAGGKLTLKDSTHTGGGLNVSEGTVELQGDVNFENCTSDGNGGALNITGGEVTLAAGANVTMTGCTATENGGAIYVDGGKFDATNGSLDIASSSANGKGGAVYVGSNDGTAVTLGDGVSTQNNNAEKGNGVYVEDGATLTLSTTGATGIADGIMLGHTEGVEGNASIELTGEAPAEGKTIVVEFEDAAKQLDPEESHNQYITSGTLDSQALKNFMRVKNAGYTFDPSANDGSLGLMEANSVVAVVQEGEGDHYFTNVQDAINYIEGNGKTGTAYLTTYENNAADPPIKTEEITLEKAITIPDGVDITLKSGKVTADAEGGKTFAPSDSPVTLKRDSTLFDEMIKVEKGGTLTVENVILDGGADWDKDMAKPNGYEAWTAEAGKVKIADDGNGGAGTVETNNKGTVAHAPVIVNAGTLTLGNGSTIQNNDNNWAEPGVGFGSENYGGGVRNEGAGKLTMNAGAAIRDCYSREGGAIMNVNKPQKTNGSDNPAYDSEGYPTVEIKGGTITGNVSQTKGAAVQTVYGGANTTVSGGEIEGNVSCHDLGVLTVEEGGSLTVSDGTVSVEEGANALYLYNQYSAEDYKGATNKPYIEGKDDENVGKLTVSGTPTITGDVHVDKSCYVVDSETGSASQTYYDSYVDVTDYTGSNLDLTFDKGDGKIAKGDATKLTYEQDDAANGVLSDTYTFTYTDTYTDGEGTWLAQGSYELEFSQTEVNSLHVSGKVDPACGTVTVTIGEQTYELTPNENGEINTDIDLTAYAETAESGIMNAALSFGYGTDGTGNVKVEGVPLAAVLQDGEGKYIFPNGTQYKNEEGTFADMPAGGVLPEDLAVDGDGKATFKWTSPEETEVTLSVGNRESAPTINGSAADLKDVTGNSLTLQPKDGNLEYQLRDSEGKAVTDWMKPNEQGVLEFKGLDAGKEYTLYARTPANAGEGTLPSASVECSADVHTTLTDDQQSARAAFDDAFNANFTPNEEGGGYTLNEGTTTDDLKGIVEKYTAFEGTKPADEVLALFAEQRDAAQAAYDDALADDWLKAHEKALQQAANYAAEGDKPYPDVEETTSEQLKSALEAADKAFNELSEGAKTALSVKLAEAGLGSALDAYIAVAKKDMQADIDGLGETLQSFGEAFLNTLSSAESIDAAKNVENNFNGAKDAAGTIQDAYANAVTEAGESERTKALLEETLEALYNELVTLPEDGDYNAVAEKAAAAFALDVKRSKAQDAFVEAFDAVAQGVMEKPFDEVTTDDFMNLGDGNFEITNQEKFDLYTAAQTALSAIATAENDEIETALKDAVKALLTGTVTDGVTSLTGSVMRDGDSKAVKEYLTGVADKVGSATDSDGDGLSDVVGALEGVSDELSAKRAAEVAEAVQDYKDVYKLLKGTDAAVPEDATKAIKEAKDAQAVNAALKEAVEELLDSMKEGAGEDLQAHIEELKGVVETTVSTADAEENRAIADLSKALAAEEKTRLSEAMSAAKDSFGEYYKTLTGAESVPEENAQLGQLNEALNGITLTDEEGNITKGIDETLKAVNDALKEAVNGVLGGLVDPTKDSAAVQGIVDRAKEAVTDEAGKLTTDEMTGLSDLSGTLENVKKAIEDQRTAEFRAAAKDALVSAYNTLNGTSYTKDGGNLPDALQKALDALDEKTTLTELNTELGRHVNSFLAALAKDENGDDIDNVKSITDAAAEKVDAAVAKANEAADGPTAADFTDALAGVKDAVDLRKAKNAAQAELDKTVEEVKDLAPDRADEIEAKLAEAKNAVEEAVDLAGVESAKENGMSDLESFAIAGVAAKEFEDAYKALKGTAPDTETLNAFKEQIKGMSDAESLNQALKDALKDLVGSDGAADSNLEAAQNALKNAIEAAQAGDAGILDFTAALDGAKEKLEFAAAQDTAIQEIEEAYEKLVGEGGTYAGRMSDDDKTALAEQKQAALGDINGKTLEKGDDETWDAVLQAAKDDIDDIVTATNGQLNIDAMKAAAKQEYLDAMTAATGTMSADASSIEAALEGKTTAQEINDALKNTLKAAIEAAIENDSKAVKDAAQKTLDALDALTNDAEIIEASDVVAKVGESGTEQTLKEALDAIRSNEREAAVEDYKAAYKEITGEEYSDNDTTAKAVVDALNDSETCPNAKALNDELKAGVEALLDALREEHTGLEAIGEIITAAQGKVNAEYDRAEGVREVGDFSAQVEGLKASIDSEQSKADAETAFESAYEAITGEKPSDAEKNAFKDSLKDATTAEQIQEELKKAAKEVIEESAGTGTFTDQAVEAAKQAIDAYDGSISEFAEAVGGIWEAVADAQSHDKAQDELDAAKEQAISDLQSAYDAVGQGGMSAEGKAELDGALENAKNAVNGVTLEKNDGETWESALDGARAQLTETVEGAQEELTAIALRDTAAEEYAQAYSAAKGTEGLEEAKQTFRETVADMTSAAELDAALKEAVEGLIADMVTANDSATVQKFADDAKKEVAAADGGEDGIADGLPEIAERAKAAIEGARETERENAIADYVESYNALTGENVDKTSDRVKDVVDGLASAENAKELNEKTKSAVEALLEGMRQSGDSQTAKDIIDGAKEAVAQAVIQANGEVADLSEAVKETKAQLDAQRADDSTHSADSWDRLVEELDVPPEYKEKAQELLEAAKESAADSTSEERALIEEKLKAQLEVLEQLAEKTEAGKEEELPQAALDSMAEEAEKAYGEIERAQTAADARREVEEFVGAAEGTFEGEKFAKENSVVGKAFDEITEEDLEGLGKASESFNELGDRAKNYLDEKVSESYPKGFGDSLEDKIAKAEFEAKKRETVEEAKKPIHEHDGENVKETLQKAIERIDEIEYEPHADDATRESYASGLEAELNAALEAALEDIECAQAQQRFVNNAIKEIEERAESGRYNKAQQAELNAVFEEEGGFRERVNGIPASETAQEEIEELYEEFLAALNEVSSDYVTAGDLRPDRTSPEGDAADYDEETDDLWGIVKNEKALNGTIELFIKKTTTDQKIEEAAKNGGLVAADGSEIPEKELESRIAGKEVKGAFDIYLLKDNVKVTEFYGMYTVQVLLPASMRSAGGLQIVYVAEDGSVQVYDTEKDGNYLVFTTSHFSEFIVLGEHELNLWWLILTLAIILGVELIVLLFVLTSEDKKDYILRSSALPLSALLLVFIPNGAIVMICILAGAIAVVTLTLIVALLLKRKDRKTYEEQSRRYWDE